MQALRTRTAELLRLVASPSYRNKTAAVATLAALAAARAACTSEDTVHTSDLRVRRMPPLWLDRVRAKNVSDTLPEALEGETSLHGRVKLVAPPGLDEGIAQQLLDTLNRLVTAAEEQADALVWGQHIKGHTWNLVVRRYDAPNASTLDGSLFVTAGMIVMLREEVRGWQAALAGVLAHELGHNMARHVLENQLDHFLFRWALMLRAPFQLVRQAIAARGLPGSDWVDRWHDEDVGALCRQREHEADELAVSILARAGYPPDSLAAVLPLLEGPPPSWARRSSPGQQPSWHQRLLQSVLPASWHAGQREAAMPAGDAGPLAGAAQEQRHGEKGVGRAAEGGGGGPDTHPETEERMARMRRLAREAEVQRLYHAHSWWTRQRLAWR